MARARHKELERNIAVSLGCSQLAFLFRSGNFVEDRVGERERD